jgi:hypothetical protein
MLVSVSKKKANHKLVVLIADNVRLKRKVRRLIEFEEFGGNTEGCIV